MADKFDGWNYRVVKEKEKTGNNFFFSIRDVYYKDGIPYGWGAEPQHPVGETRSALEADAKLMARAFRKPTLVVKGSRLVEL